MMPSLLPRRSQAGRLTEADATAVAAWLSALPSPADPEPAARGSLAMPLARGGVP